MGSGQVGDWTGRWLGSGQVGDWTGRWLGTGQVGAGQVDGWVLDR